MNEQCVSMMNQQQQMMSMMGMNSHPQLQQPRAMNQSFVMWPQAPLPQAMDQMKFQNPSFNAAMMKPQGLVMGKQSKSLRPRSNWKGKNMNKRMHIGRRNEKMIGAEGASGSYLPSSIDEVQQQHRLNARRFFPKKKFHNFDNNNRDAPFAPRNTTSFIIRAKKSGGITSLVSPCPVTPAVLPTPNFSPSREVVGDMAKEEWGLDGYGSMKGLIRLRSPGQDLEPHEDEDGVGGESSESDVEELVEVERRLDHDLSRFEMINPNYGLEYNNVLENRVDDQDAHIAQLEEENLVLKERLFLMERELSHLRRSLHSLERHNNGENLYGEVVTKESGSETESSSDGPSVDNNVEMAVENEEIVFVNQNSKNTDNAEIETANTEGNIVKDIVEFEGTTPAESKKGDRDLQGKEDKKQQDVEVKEHNHNLNSEVSENVVPALADVSSKEASHMDDEMNV